MFELSTTFFTVARDRIAAVARTLEAKAHHAVTRVAPNLAQNRDNESAPLEALPGTTKEIPEAHQKITNL